MPARAVAVLCHLTEDKEVLERGGARGVGAEADAADVGAVVLHGDGADGDADVPAVNVADELDAVVVALSILHQPIEVPRHCVNLAQTEGTASASVPSVCVCYQTRFISPLLRSSLEKRTLNCSSLGKGQEKCRNSKGSLFPSGIPFSHLI